MSKPETPRLITIQITPKVEDDDAYKLAQTYTVTKLTASEMKLKGLRPDLIGKQNESGSQSLHCGYQAFSPHTEEIIPPIAGLYDNALHTTLRCNTKAQHDGGISPHITLRSYYIHAPLRRAIASNFGLMIISYPNQPRRPHRFPSQHQSQDKILQTKALSCC